MDILKLHMRINDILGEVSARLDQVSDDSDLVESLSTAWYVVHAINGYMTLPSGQRKQVLTLPSVMRWPDEGILSMYKECVASLHALFKQEALRVM